MPVLPLVASMTVCPGLSAPVRSASSITARAMRSFTEPSGLKDSSLAYTCTPGGASLWRRTSGVLPIVSSMLSYRAMPPPTGGTVPPHPVQRRIPRTRASSLEDRQLERQLPQRPHAAPVAVAAGGATGHRRAAGNQARGRALPGFGARHARLSQRVLRAEDLQRRGTAEPRAVLQRVHHRHPRFRRPAEARTGGDGGR